MSLQVLPPSVVRLILAPGYSSYATLLFLGFTRVKAPSVCVVRADDLEVGQGVLRERQAVGEELLEPEHDPRRDAAGLLRRVRQDPLVVPGLDPDALAEREQLVEDGAVRGEQHLRPA